MRVGSSRDQLLVEMKAARSRMLAAVDGLSDVQASRAERDGGSVKDHLSPLTACDEFRFYEIGRVSRGVRTAFASGDDEQMDALNAIIVALRRNMTLEELIADLEFARSLVLEAIGQAPEHALTPSECFEIKHIKPFYRRKPSMRRFDLAREREGI